MAEFKLKASVRDNSGKNDAHKVRQSKSLPAVIFHKGEKSENIIIDDLAFQMCYLKAGMTNIIDIEIDGRKRPVIVKEVQRHPFKNQILHVSFQGINMNEQIKIHIPIELIGRDEIRLQPSVLNQVLDSVEIECLPKDMPEKFEYNVENMQYDDVVKVADLEGVKDPKISLITDSEEVVCSLSLPREEKEEEEENVDAADVPVVGEEKKEEE